MMKGNDFKIGDRVRFIDKSDTTFFGKVGNVIDKSRDYDSLFNILTVEFDKNQGLNNGFSYSGTWFAKRFEHEIRYDERE